jgi:hypothetical protein
MSREFEIRREIDLPATPEEVWEAIATPEGNEAWLFPGLLDPEQAQVYEPPHRFLIRMEGEDGWFNSIEDIIEARGGSTVLRYVHSGIFTEDWDNQYDAADKHTDFYLHTLGEYLRHFKGRTATYVGGGPDGILAPESSSQPDSLDRLKRALGLDPDTSAGETVRLDVDGLEPQDAVVDYATPHFLGIRTGDALYRFFGRGTWGMPTGMSAHLFAENADGQRTADAWSAWMSGVFA